MEFWSQIAWWFDPSVLRRAEFDLALAPSLEKPKKCVSTKCYLSDKPSLLAGQFLHHNTQRSLLLEKTPVCSLGESLLYTFHVHGHNNRLRSKDAAITKSQSMAIFKHVCFDRMPTVLSKGPIRRSESWISKSNLMPSPWLSKISLTTRTLWEFF